MGNGCSCFGKAEVDVLGKIKGSAEMGVDVPQPDKTKKVTKNNPKGDKK